MSVSDLAAGCARGLKIHPPKRGRREDRVRAAPAVSRAIVHRNAHTSIQVQRKHSGLPCAMALRLMPCSPRRRIRLVTVAGGLRFCQTRLGYQNLRQLDISNGCRNHTVLPYAASSFVCALLDRSRETRPAITSRARRCRVHRIPPRVSDDPDTPLFRDGMAGVLKVIWGGAEVEYFFERDWTGQITLKSLQKIARARMSGFACRARQ